MAKTYDEDDETPLKARPTLSHEANENRLIAMAEKEAEYLIANHKASPQIITHFLKLGCEKTRLEQEKLRSENELLRAKTEQLKAAKVSEEFYGKVLAAIRDYSGYGGDDNEIED